VQIQDTHIASINHIKLTRVLLLVGIFCSLFFRTGFSQVSQEYLIKAVYIEKFTRFIEWPEHFSVNDTTKPFYIGIVGKSNMSTTLRNVYRNLRIRNKQVMIEEFSGVDDLKSRGHKHHVIFIPPDSEEWLDDVIEFSVENSNLTIGDGIDYAKRGVHINFIVFEDRVQYAINESSVYDSDLFMSYRLLNSARIVGSD
jgi:hypothetical protein